MSWLQPTEVRHVVCKCQLALRIPYSSELWDLGQGVRRVCLTEGFNSITHVRYLYNHISYQIVRLRLFAFGAQPKVTSYDEMPALPLHVKCILASQVTQMTPVALALVAFVTGYNLYNIE